MKFFNLNIDGLFSNASDTEISSQKAVKTYVDNSVANVLPSKTDKGGKFLKVSTDGSSLEWGEIDVSKTYHRRTETISSDTTTPPSFEISEGFSTCAVYLDGVLAVEGTSYTVTDNVITFTDNLLGGSVVDIVWYTAFNVGTAPKTYQRLNETFDNDTTTPPSWTIDGGFEACQVYLDGVLATEGTTYTISGNVISFKDNLLGGSVVDIVWYTAYDVGALPTATETKLGTVRVGEELSVTSDGTLSGVSLNTVNSAILELMGDYDLELSNIIDYTTAPTGRKYYRHPSGMGTVMCWNDNGTERQTLILDMQYTDSGAAWGAEEDVSTLGNYDTSKVFNNGNGMSILGSSDSALAKETASKYDGQTDEVLDANLIWRDESTSRQNTNALIAQYPNSTYAANFCRSITVNGVGCDLPNIQTLIRIFCDRATIHSLDPTDTDDEWTNWFGTTTSSGLGMVWTSTESTSSNAWFLMGNGITMSIYPKTTGLPIVATLDLDKNGNPIDSTDLPLVKIVSNAGRKFYRHSSGMGTVMEWQDNGVTRKTLVVDMKYNPNAKKYYGEDYDISGITNYSSAPFNQGSGSNQYFILSKDSTEPTDYETQTDAVLDSHFNWRDENTSTDNTDALLSKYTNGVSSYDYAANACRNVVIGGIGCDLPNMQTLVRMFCERATLHQMDESDTNNYWSTWFNASDVLSSSETSSANAWNVSYNGGVWSDAKASFACYVLPVLELDVDASETTNAIDRETDTPTGDYVTSPSGRKYARHSSGMGTVMYWNDNGVRRKTLILDMQYIDSQSEKPNWSPYWCSDDAIQNVTQNLSEHSELVFGNGSNYILGKRSTTASDYENMSDFILDNKFKWRDENTSRQNTDVIVKALESTSAVTKYAASICRDVTVDGVGCDLPNMQTLVRIYCDRATIHSLDPTDTKDNWTQWFTQIGNDSRDFCWASTYHSTTTLFSKSSYYACAMDNEGCVSSQEHSYSERYGSIYCIPVLDLD